MKYKGRTKDKLNGFFTQTNNPQNSIEIDRCNLTNFAMIKGTTNADMLGKRSKMKEDIDVDDFKVDDDDRGGVGNDAVH
jgi:hypothetical protein